MLLRQNALLRFYYREDPYKWTDKKWCIMVAELDYVLIKVGILQIDKTSE